MEHALLLRPSRIQTLSSTTDLQTLRRLLRRHKPTTKRAQSSAYKGGGLFWQSTLRQQRVIVKIAYTSNRKSRSWAAHGHYLQRDHAQIEGQRGHGFTADKHTVDIKEVLDTWQKTADEHFFKLIISPEQADQLNLVAYCSTLIPRLEHDLKTRLEWIAIDHHNTDQPHIHLLIRGRDQRGETLKISRDYLSQGIRIRAQELATQQLGLRTDLTIQQGRQRQINRDYLTDLDRTLRREATEGIISFETPVPAKSSLRTQRLQLIKRLQHLEALGLAKKTASKRWRLNEHLESTLKQLQLANDVLKSHAQTQSVGWKTILTRTQVTAEQPLHGKVIGMGLTDELQDKRYLLLESANGKLHYLEATASIMRAREQGVFCDGDTVSLSQQVFKSQEGKTVNYVQVIKHETQKHALNFLKKQRKRYGLGI